MYEHRKDLSEKILHDLAKVISKHIETLIAITAIVTLTTIGAIIAIVLGIVIESIILVKLAAITMLVGIVIWSFLMWLFYIESNHYYK